MARRQHRRPAARKRDEQPAPTGEMDRPRRPAPRLSNRKAAGLLVLLLLFALYSWNRGHLQTGDNRAIAEISWMFGQGEPLRLNGHPTYESISNEGWYGYWAYEREDGLIASIYPPGTALFSAPFFRLATLLGIQIPSERAAIAAKTIAALLMALSGVCIWWVVGETVSFRSGAICAVLAGAASPLYSSLSQALWIQTGALFSQALSIGFLLPFLLDGRETGPPVRRGLLALGSFFAVWAGVCRPTFFLWTIAFAAAVWFYARRDSWAFFPGAAAAALIGAWINWTATGSPIGIYHLKATEDAGFAFDIASLSEACEGLLFSPGRGLLLFAPWTVLIVAGIVWASVSRGPLRAWYVLHAAFVLLTFAVLCAFQNWWGGWSKGPRLQSDILISGAIVAAPVVDWLARRLWGGALLLILFLPSFLIQHRAAYTPQWEARLSGPVEESLWDWRNGAWRWYATKGTIERSLRGEDRSPVWDRPILSPSQPDAAKFLDYGMAISMDGLRFEATSREAAFAFIPPRDAPRRETLLAVNLVEGAPQGYLRKVDLLVNGRRLKQISMLSGREGRSAYALIPPGALGQEPYDRFTLREKYPPQRATGHYFLAVTQLVLYPADSEEARGLTARIDEAAKGTAGP